MGDADGATGVAVNVHGGPDHIEKTVHEIGRKYHVTVATSDALEQMIIWGQGATRLSAQGLREEVESVGRQRQEEWKAGNPGERYFPFEALLKKGDE